MRKASAIAGSVAFFVAAPCIVAGALPWLASRSGWMPFDAPGLVDVVAWAAIVGGVGLLVQSFARFALDGLGTPAPVAPTERLVVQGPYRHVRNPMYVAVISIILASGVLYGEAAVFLYGAVAAATMMTFVRVHEEPALTQRYGAAYETYSANVPGWVPRLTPWQGPQ